MHAVLASGFLPVVGANRVAIGRRRRLRRGRACPLILLAAPVLLADAPSCLPSIEGGPTIVRLRGRGRNRCGCRVWAALRLELAAPFLLGDGPTRLPIAEASCAIVARPGRLRREHVRRRRRTADALVLAAPELLLLRPTLCPIHDAGLAVVRDRGGSLRATFLFPQTAPSHLACAPIFGCVLAIEGPGRGRRRRRVCHGQRLLRRREARSEVVP
mmetsp:Transcript_69965/g.176280  ORF Transcript_69965/g.176280 Transcript_69965/m.176280 type:complete len:215 (+) Transcript_69965:1175-1819(+)